MISHLYHNQSTPLVILIIMLNIKFIDHLFFLFRNMNTKRFTKGFKKRMKRNHSNNGVKVKSILMFKILN
jgi:hypothetical protein